VRALVVEDDPSIAEPLAEGLRRYAYEVEMVTSGSAALAADLDVDVVLLDLGLPDIDGIEVCRQLRTRSQVPIIVVSARSDELDRVVGLEVGADDYVVKPFGLRELVARIHAVTRRAARAASAPGPGGGDQAVRLGELSLDRRTREVRVGGRAVALSPKEYDVLALLLEDPGAVVTRETLIERVWDTNWFGPTKTLDVHVASLRRKLGHPDWVQTVRGVGFRAAAPPPATP
jgi:DNA-binding response OmpR family regulator